MNSMLDVPRNVDVDVIPPFHSLMREEASDYMNIHHSSGFPFQRFSATVLHLCQVHFERPSNL